MHPSIRLLASEAATSTSGPLRRAPFALLPPIPLYRRLLRAHRRHLPLQERTLGDAYVKSEWRLHRKAENPMHIIGFLTEWQLYAQHLEGENWKGDKMDKAKIDKLSGAYSSLSLTDAGSPMVVAWNGVADERGRPADWPNVRVDAGHPRPSRRRERGSCHDGQASE